MMKQIESTYMYQQGGFIAVVVAGLVIVFLTLFVSRLSVHIINRALKRTTDGQVEGSIITNIIQVVMWVLGISFLLKVCFNYNTSVLWGALGIGGIALSFGLQNTISNLIGGLQISLSRDLTLGDWVKIGDVTGQIKDITWRIMKIDDSSGNTIIIPNSMFNTTAVKVLPDHQSIYLPLVFSYDVDLRKIQDEVPKIAYKALQDNGYAYENMKPELSIDGTAINSVNATLAVFTSYESSSMDIRECIIPPIIDYLKSSEAIASYSD